MSPISLEKLIYILFGWLLGLLAPTIIEKNRRTYRIKDLKIAITAELHELQYLMAALSYSLNSYSAQLTDEFLSWFELIILHYQGEEPTERVREILSVLRKVPESNRYAISHPNGNEEKAIGLIEYSLPLLNAHISEIAIMPIAFQVWSLRITKKLDMFNQRVVSLQRKLEKTFDSSLSDKNRTIIESELKSGYKDLANQAKKIADLISQEPKSWHSLVGL